MNDELKALLSAYLDGQVTPAQRRQIEDLLARDPAVRAEWEDLQTFAQQINAAAGPQATVPADFREKIMARLKSGGSGPQRPGGGWSATGGMGLTAAGLVLIGLLGTFMFLDRQSNRTAETPQARPSPEALEDSAQAARGGQPAYRGEIRPARPEDIQSTASGRMPDALRHSSARLDGEAYLAGAAPRRPRAARGEVAAWTEVAAGPEAPAPGLDLERFDAWTAEETAARISGSGLTPAGLTRLAQTYRLHPGLLLAACQDLPRLGAEAAARRLRGSLDASAGQPENQRLRKAVADLGGDPSWEPRWKKSLSHPE